MLSLHLLQWTVVLKAAEHLSQAGNSIEELGGSHVVQRMTDMLDARFDSYKPLCTQRMSRNEFMQYNGIADPVKVMPEHCS